MEQINNNQTGSVVAAYCQTREAQAGPLKLSLRAFIQANLGREGSRGGSLGKNFSWKGSMLLTPPVMPALQQPRFVGLNATFILPFSPKKSLRDPPYSYPNRSPEDAETMQAKTT